MSTLSNLIAELSLRTKWHVTWHLHVKSAWCVALDLHTIAPRPLEHTCWRQLAVLWEDCKKSQITPLNVIIIIIIKSSKNQPAMFHFRILLDFNNTMMKLSFTEHFYWNDQQIWSFVNILSSLAGVAMCSWKLILSKLSYGSRQKTAEANEYSTCRIKTTTTTTDNATCAFSTRDSSPPSLSSTSSSPSSFL